MECGGLEPFIHRQRVQINLINLLVTVYRAYLGKEYEPEKPND